MADNPLSQLCTTLVLPFRACWVAEQHLEYLVANDGRKAPPEVHHPKLELSRKNDDLGPVIPGRWGAEK